VDSYYDPEQGGINMVQAKDMWENPDILTEDAREALVNVGIDSAYKFMQYLNQEGEYKMRMLAVEDTANYYFTSAGNPPIDSKNSESRHAFQAFATNIMTNAPTALSVLDSVNPMGLTEEEWNNRNEWMGLQEGPTFIGVDTAVNRITETLGIPMQLLLERGAVEETRNGLQINDRVMRMFIRDISTQMSDAYEVVDTLAQW
jgi:hypothetical protein